MVRVAEVMGNKEEVSDRATPRVTSHLAGATEAARSYIPMMDFIGKSIQEKSYMAERYRE